MELITIFILSMGLSMDCFGIAIVNGMAPKSIRPGTKLKLALSFSLAHFIMIIAGYYIGNIAGLVLKDIDHWIAFLILFLVGVKMIFSNLSINITSKVLNINSVKVIIGLSMATSIDAMIAGASLPFLNYKPLLVAFPVAIIVFFMTFTGIHAGKQLGMALGKYASTMGGILIIGASIANMLPHIL